MPQIVAATPRLPGARGIQLPPHGVVDVAGRAVPHYGVGRRIQVGDRHAGRAARRQVQERKMPGIAIAFSA